MVIGRAFRATGCASCRLSLIRSFTSSTGSATRVPRAPTRYPRSGTPSHFRYSSQLTRDNQYLDEVKKDDKEARSEEEELEDLLEEELDAEYGTKDGGEVSAIPWYLQVESPTRTPQPLSERQKIPELPATPPPILEPLLQQISVDLGMDDLKLLDLRKLDPPPALGANLLMILGTARSERHLHVSADRLCRWLRSTYKLRPDADGLLGRNELKLKLKRKAKRAKLLGSAADENGDDGVRTGWVCVDLGVVEPDAAAVEAPQRQDFIGFGRRVDGVRIVVQMLTEEKREEIELERLWEGILKRGGQHELESPVEDQENHISTPDSSRSPSLGSPASTLGQRRAMHTSARRPSMMQESIPESAYHMPPGPASATPFETFDLRTIQEEAQRYINSGNFEQAATHLKSYSNIIPALKGDGWQKIFLTSLRIHIENVPKSQALEELSIPAPGSEPTPFMACFQSAMTFYPTQFAVESEIWLHSFARTIEHPDYDLPSTAGFLKKLQGYGVQISKASYMVLIRSLLLLKQDNGPKRESAHIVLDILRVMQDQGLQILDENMFVELQELTEPPKGYVYQQYWVDQTPFTYDIESQMPTALQRRLHLIMMKLDFPPFSDELTIRLLNLHARNRCWSEFWDVFSMAPRALVAQSPAVYAYMFACVANSGSQKGCMTVLRNWVPRMESEDPPVKLEGDVAAAVKVCVMIADPTVVKDQKNTSKSRGEWGRLWDRCQ